MATDATYETYYVPADSKLPIFASLGIFLTVFGLGNWFNDLTAGNESSTGRLDTISGRSGHGRDFVCLVQ